ncbi:hypothetical protein S8a_00002 [Klebsiella phage VLCpiS8a]|nr:hypothetical protein S8a_00002 [Klebsiella phage VLCpiS8a]
MIDLSKLTRYDIKEMSGNPFESYRCIEEDEDGDYVRVEDVQALVDAHNANSKARQSNTERMRKVRAAETTEQANERRRKNAERMRAKRAGK